MKRTGRILSLLLLLAAFAAVSACAAAEAPTAIEADVEDAMLLPFLQNQAIAVRYPGAEEVELRLLDAGGEQQSIRFPCERGNFYFVPSTREAPEFLVYQRQGSTLTWYVWKDDGLVPLRQWALDGGALPRIKPEGMLLVKSGAGSVSKTLEFVDMQQQTLLTLDAPKANANYDDVVFTGDSWVLLAREDISNRYALQCVGPAGDLLWTLDLPDVQGVDGLFPDGAGGLWLAHSPTYTGPLILCHVNAGGVMDHELQLDGEPRVKHLHSSQTLDPGSAILYGTAVASSKGVYHAFALTLSSGGEILDFEVRHYTPRRDYSITVEQSATGAVYVSSSTVEGAGPLLWPYDALQVVTDHGLTIREN